MLKKLIDQNPKLLWPLIVLAGSVFIVMLLMVTRPEIKLETLEIHHPVVRVQVADPAREVLQLRSQGTVRPLSESALIPEVSGQVVWLSSSMVSGGYFEEGERLLRIDQSDYLSAVDKSKAAVTRAEVEFETANAEYKRTLKLHKQQLASPSQLDQAQRSFRVAEANLVDARINLKQADRDLTRTELLAPFTGRISSEHVDLGQFVQRGSSIATMYGTEDIEVRLPIANSQLAFLDLPLGYRGQLRGDRATDVTLTGNYGGVVYRWPAKLVRTEAEIDTASRMFYVVARASNREDAPDLPTLTIGLFVNAEIVGRPVDNVVVLPRTAMRDGSRVLIVDEENRLRFRDVEILRVEADTVMIGAGLAAGDHVCISPLQVAVDGMLVEPVMVDQPQSADVDKVQEEAAQDETAQKQADEAASSLPEPVDAAGSNESVIDEKAAPAATEASAQ